MSVNIVDSVVIVQNRDDLICVITNMRKWGCCPRCILRFLGVKAAEVFRLSDITAISAWMNDVLPSKHENKTEEQPMAIDNPAVGGDNDIQVDRTCSIAVAASSLKSELSLSSDLSNHHLICVSCLGILQEHYCSASFVNDIACAVKEQQFEYDTFICSISLPVSLLLREHAIFLALQQLLPSVYGDVKEEIIATVKDVWKWVNGPELASKLSCPFDQKSPFDITVSFDYAKSDAECNFLYKLHPEIFRKRKKNKGRGKQTSSNLEPFTRANVSRAIDSTSVEAFRRAFKCPPMRPLESVTLSPVVCQHAALYIAGRYNKFSRELSQTPWLIDGVRKTESSVEEYICKPLGEMTAASDWRFSASGREDVDVRMLGTGRPFVAELVNPHRVRFTSEQMKATQETINSSTNDVAVRDLQIVQKEETSVLKQGEEEKRKRYIAVCWSRDELTDEQLSSLGAMNNVVLRQKTPIRVLHRRPLHTRERTVYNLTGHWINAQDRHHFVITLQTQAGTYIKEFVHGDFGRTVPNLGSLLGTECDILQLDVLAVELDWPPSLEPSADDTDLPTTSTETLGGENSGPAGENDTGVGDISVS